MRNKILGCLYGSIVGDIVGSYNEFLFPNMKSRVMTRRKVKYRHVTHQTLLNECSVFGFRYGAYTDDTSMSLALMDTYVNKQKIPHLMKNFSDWSNHGKFSSVGHCFDIGGQTAMSIYHAEKGCYYTEHDEIEKAGGNGALMRIHPASLYTYFHKQAAIRSEIIGVAHCTHPNKESDKYCLWFTELIHLILDGAIKSEIQQWVDDVRGDDYWEHGIQSGYVKTTFETAVTKFLETDTFMQGVLEITNRGDDSDTVAAIYGAIAGAYYGVDEIPEWYLDNINNKQYTTNLIETFTEMLLK